MGKLQIKVQRHNCNSINLSETVTDPGEGGHAPPPVKQKIKKRKMVTKGGRVNFMFIFLVYRVSGSPAVENTTEGFFIK